MGTAYSSEGKQEALDHSEDIWWKDNTESNQFCDQNICNDSEPEGSISSDQNSQKSNIKFQKDTNNCQKLDVEFQKDLLEKRQLRHSLINAKKKELNELRKELEKQKEQNIQLRLILERQNDDSQNDSLLELIDENERLKTEVNDLKLKLADQNETVQEQHQLKWDFSRIKEELDSMSSQVALFEKEREEYSNHVKALKDVINVSKMMMEIREQEVNQLKEKLTELENSQPDQQELVQMSDELKTEYERQLRNLKTLRALYEEKSRISRIERQNLTDQLNAAQEKLNQQTNKNNELEERINELETNVSTKYDEIASLQSNLGLANAEFRGLKNEINVINQLFSQILLDSNSNQDIDLDKLIELLEENHDLLTNIVVKEESPEISTALPKVLLNLVAQINQKKNYHHHQEDVHQNNENQECQTTSQNMNSAQDIVNKLPKVWKVLTELLSHHTINPVEIGDDIKSSTTEHPCYNTVETPSGIKNVLSVSKTYIRLKDLILEKKYLEKEMLRMKHLNIHLEERLQEQEKRLNNVTQELSKTWTLVDKMKKQHDQLHTQEQILRYELSQKRKLLNELKEELEYCRINWIKAREKNNESDIECQKLRKEFASRRSKTLPSGLLDLELNNSAESGYSDDLDEDTSDDEVVSEAKSLDDQFSKSKVSDNDEDTVEIKYPDEEKLEDEKYISNEPAEVNCNINNEGSIEQVECIEVSENDEVNKNMLDIDNGTNEVKIEAKHISSNESLQIASSDLSEKSVIDNTYENDQINGQIQELNENVPSCSYSNEAANSETTTENPNRLQKLEEQFNKLMDKYVSHKVRVEKIVSDTLNDNMKLKKTPEQILGEREERFKRLEEQCKQLKNKYARQAQLGESMCEKLVNLHEQYGSEENKSKENVTEIVVEQIEFSNIEFPIESYDKVTELDHKVEDNQIREDNKVKIDIKEETDVKGGKKIEGGNKIPADDKVETDNKIEVDNKVIKLEKNNEIEVESKNKIKEIEINKSINGETMLELNEIIVEEIINENIEINNKLVENIKKVENEEIASASHIFENEQQNKIDNEIIKKNKEVEIQMNLVEVEEGTEENTSESTSNDTSEAATGCEETNESVQNSSDENKEIETNNETKNDEASGKKSEEVDEELAKRLAEIERRYRDIKERFAEQNEASARLTAKLNDLQGKYSNLKFSSNDDDESLGN